MKKEAAKPPFFVFYVIYLFVPLIGNAGAG